jgi:4-amino-4-deoxy-L-arabinose transferase-like glycosyltransferase
MIEGVEGMSILRPLTTVLKDRKIWALLLILGLGTYLRLWPIHLFKWIQDYDEGAYSMGARFISQGYLPYRDFTLVHPPFYDLVLASIYKLFGYNFFYGRYLSVVLFLACVVLAYLIVKKLYNASAGLVASALFAVFPGLSSLWYRAVQEPLGIFLILLAVLLATDYIMRREHINCLLLSGLCLGLALATKYTFAPAVIAFTVAIAVLTMEGRWRQLRSILLGLLSRELWLLIVGIVLGFLLVTGFFIITTTHEFLTQTMLSQLGYRLGGTLHTIVRRVMAIRSGTLTDNINTLCLFVPFFVLVALLIRRKLSRHNRFLLVALLVSLPLCASFNPFGEIRYFVSVFIFTLLAIASFMPALDAKALFNRVTLQTAWKTASVMAMSLALLAFISGTAALIRDYNFMGLGKLTYEEQAYKEAADYLEQVGAKKVYALNPIIPALYPQLSSSLEFDTFALLLPLRESAATIIQQQLSEGVDYMVIDAFGWLSGIFHRETAEVVREIQRNGVLVKTIVLGDLPILGVQIYAVRSP